MFVVDTNLIKHVKLSTLYTAKLRCRQHIYLPYKFENIVAYYVTYKKFSYFTKHNLQDSIHKFSMMLY